VTDVSPQINIDVLVTLDIEHPAFQAAVRQLNRRLRVASGAEINVVLNLGKTIPIRQAGQEPGVILISLLGGVAATDLSFDDLAASWWEQISTLMINTDRPVYICTVFRHVPPASESFSRKQRQWLQERIRRINLLAIEISQATGVNVIDLDRAMTYVGAKILQTDFMLSGKLGAEVAGDVIATTLISTALDEIVTSDTLTKAQQISAGIEGVVSRVPFWKSRTMPERQAHAG